MANLYDILADAQHGQAIAELGSAYGLDEQQTEAAVAALLPAISLGLKRSTATPEDLGNLLALMGRQPDLFAMYDDPRLAFSRGGRDAGNAALATMFGSPDASRAIANQAQYFSGVTSSILKKLLPVIAGVILSGLMRSGSGQATPSPAPAPAPQPEQGGGILSDILREIFKTGPSGGSAGPASGPSPIPPIGDILGQRRDGSPPPTPTPQPAPVPESKPAPIPTGPDGQPVPGGDLLSQILRELEKGIREGKIKPVIVGPYEIDIPGQAGPGDKQQVPGGDIFGQILRDLLGGATQGKTNVGSAVFGDRIEAGRNVAKDQVASFQDILEQFLGPPRR